MRPRDRVTDAQPQPASVRLGRKKGIKEPWKHVNRNPAPGVRHQNTNVLVDTAYLNTQLSALTARHRLRRIAIKIPQHLLQLLWIGAGPRYVVVELRDQLDPLPNEVSADQIQCLERHGGHVRRLDVRWSGARKTQYALDNLCDPPRLPIDRCFAARGFEGTCIGRPATMSITAFLPLWTS